MPIGETRHGEKQRLLLTHEYRVAGKKYFLSGTAPDLLCRKMRRVTGVPHGLAAQTVDEPGLFNLSGGWGASTFLLGDRQVRCGVARRR
jgi:hypothetical protein